MMKKSRIHVSGHEQAIKLLVCSCRIERTRSINYLRPERINRYDSSACRARSTDALAYWYTRINDDFNPTKGEW